MVKPTLKWAGGKRGLIDDIIDRFPNQYDTYHEPFFGGGALFFSIEPKNGTINDKNKRLINYYKQVKNNPKKLIRKLRSYKDPESDPDKSLKFSDKNRKNKQIDSYYYQVRELFNRRPNDESFDELEEASQLQYLNRTCYNGLYRENSSGEFNTPIGRYDNPDWVLEDRVMEASEVLQNTKILCNDFEYILDVVEESDLVYFDPPYKPLSKTANFTEYSADGFDKEDQKRLASTIKKLDNMGVYVILSNSAVMFDKYDDVFEVEYVKGERSISCDSENRGDVKEILVSNT